LIDPKKEKSGGTAPHKIPFPAHPAPRDMFGDGEKTEIICYPVFIKSGKQPFRI
jgi:hypothetical protein